MELNSKEAFVTEMKLRTKTLAFATIVFSNGLVKATTTYIITKQLIRSATSVGANYRAACKARSRKEFFSKLSIVIEEIDETLYWLELVDELKLSNDKNQLRGLLKEAMEINKILSKARGTMYS